MITAQRQLKGSSALLKNLVNVLSDTVPETFILFSLQPIDPGCFLVGELHDGSSELLEVHNPICGRVTAVTPEGFKAMVLVGLSQNLHQSTYEELIPLVQQLETALDLFQGAICASEEVTQKNHLEDCCAKTGADRHHCFLQHKKRIPRDSTFHDVPRKDKCEAYEKDRVAAMGHNNTLGTAMKHTVAARIAQLKSICLVHEKYGLRVIKAKKLVQYSQKLPQATFEELAKITDQIAHMVATCCKGEMISCMKERKQLADDVCSKDELLSRTKHLAECCKLSIIERGNCIEKMEADDKPQDLSEKDDSFIKDKDVCEKYAQHGDQFLGSMLVQYTRIMPQAPYDKLMRVAHTIATVTDSCCSKDESHLLPCAEEQLTNAIDETCSETNPATINEHIDHCCNESYSERRTCILKIQPDTTFVPQPFSPDMFHLDPDMCDMAPKELLATTTRLLYDMVKLKTTITDEQFLTIGTSFLLLKAKCCTDADKALCFKAERAVVGGVDVRAPKPSSMARPPDLQSMWTGREPGPSSRSSGGGTSRGGGGNDSPSPSLSGLWLLPFLLSGPWLLPVWLSG
ncbi:albumin 2-like [Acipenser ruthenus]|uniref:albumin 2-like n=1 Tax=Acipenser ruthenus TaxID=7906 RepID=UPI00274246BF|nr:albumin 2-like [Acipenser ruthenus]